MASALHVKLYNSILSASIFISRRTLRAYFIQGFTLHLFIFRLLFFISSSPRHVSKLANPHTSNFCLYFPRTRQANRYYKFVSSCNGAPLVFNMPTHSLLHDDGTHRRGIHELNTYFLCEPLQHFDGQQKWGLFAVFTCCLTVFTRHFVSKSSTLDGAVTFPTDQALM